MKVFLALTILAYFSVSVKDVNAGKKNAIDEVDDSEGGDYEDDYTDCDDGDDCDYEEYGSKKPVQTYSPKPNKDALDKKLDTIVGDNSLSSKDTIDKSLAAVSEFALQPVHDTTELVRGSGPKTDEYQKRMNDIFEDTNSKTAVHQEEAYVNALNILGVLKKYSFDRTSDLRKAIYSKPLNTDDILVEITGRTAINFTSEQSVYEKAIVASEKEHFDIVTGLDELQQIAYALKLAYVNCKGFACQPKVGNLQMTYQTMLRKSKITTLSFVFKSKQALKWVVEAAESMENNLFMHGVTLLSKTRKLAKHMVRKTGSLIRSTTELTDLTTAVVKSANIDQVKSAEANRTFTKERHGWKVRKAKSEQLCYRLQVDIEEARRQIDDLRLKITNELNHKQAKLHITYIEGHCSRYFFSTECTDQKGHTNTDYIRDPNNEMLSKYYNLEKTMYTSKSKLVRENLKIAAELAFLKQKLKDSTKTGKDLITAINSLDIALENLRMAKTFFERVKRYWKSVASDLKMLIEHQEDTDEVIRHLKSMKDSEKGIVDLVDLKKTFTLTLVQLYGGITEEAMHWLKIGYKSHKAYRAFAKRTEEIDSVVTTADSNGSNDEILEKMFENKNFNPEEAYQSETMQAAYDRFMAARAEVLNAKN